MKSGCNELPVAGLAPFTTIDYPNHTAAVLFTPGCLWHCPYCHNPQLRSFREGTITWDKIERFLLKRRGWLEAVVISGGEPTLHPALPVCLKVIREMGFKVGLHSAGMASDRLAESLPFLNWVGLDVKAPLDFRYDRLTGEKGSYAEVVRSLEILKRSEKPFQLRFTHDPRFHKSDEMTEISRWLSDRGFPLPVLQHVRNPNHGQSTSPKNSILTP